MFSLAVSLAVGVVGYIAFHERTSVDLEGFAVANTLSSTPSGYGVDVAIVNNSLRPVIVRSVGLEVDGVPVTEASEYLPEPRILKDQSMRGDQPVDQAIAFPLAIPARGTRTIGVLFRFGRVDEVWYARRDSAALQGAKTFCSALSLRTDTDRHRIELRIDSTPSTGTTVPVTMVGPVDGGNQWFLRVIAAAHPSTAEIRRKFASPTAYRLMTLRIWGNRGGLVSRVSLPLFGAGTAFPNFPPLANGKYRIAISEGSRIVAGGRFNVPMQAKHPGLISPSAATYSNSQCEIFRHPGQRAVSPQPLPRHPVPEAPR